MPLRKVRKDRARLVENAEYERVYEDRDNYIIKEAPLYTKQKNGKIAPAPGRFIAVFHKDLAGEYPVFEGIVSDRYKIVLFKDLEKIAVKALEKNGYKLAGEPERVDINELVIPTEYELEKGLRAEIGITNSYDTKETVGFKLYVNDGERRYPAGVITKRKHFGSVNEESKEIMEEAVKEMSKHLTLFKTLWNSMVDINELSIWKDIKRERVQRLKREDGSSEPIVYTEYPLEQVKEALLKEFPNGSVPFKEMWKRILSYAQGEKRKTVREEILDRMHRQIEPLLKVFKEAKVKALKV